jgi:hypothetical protein
MISVGLVGLGCGQDSELDGSARGPGEETGTMASPVAAGPATPLAAGVSGIACADANSDRNAYYGDFHVHTSLSSDAWMFDVRTTPEDAYRYAFGGSVLLPPLDAAGAPTREHKNARPLDFMAVTDHAEFLGELKICTNPDKAGYESDLCNAIRTGTGRSPELLKLIFSPFPNRDEATCGDDLSRCAGEAATAWEEIQSAAERWNSPCEHSSFVAYEYSSVRLGSNLHRNVIFRNGIVPERPISFLEAVRDYELWEGLERECLDADTGCDVIAIPHNSNISNGRMFSINYPGAWTRAGKAELAQQRIRLEPIIEMMQHKGDSECRNGLPGVQGGVDEFCDFEKFESLAFQSSRGTNEAPPCYEGIGADWWFHRGPDCLSPMSYARTALIEGLRQEAEIGVNPFKFGLSASTDTHNGIGGAVEEATYPGHLGTGDDEPAKRTTSDTSVAGNTNQNPGGLIAVLAEQNTRDSIFDALKRKEVFGTSGPRIEVRFYGGWSMPGDLCERRDRLAQGDAHGVPMGGDLVARSEDRPPSFLVLSQADPGTASTPGTPLERLQVIKGWIGSDGERHQQIFDVAGGPSQDADVDPETCAPTGKGGYRELCRVWTDPEFDPSTRAVYYLRAIEKPTCRYSRIQCLAMDPADRPAACDDGSFPSTIQERAWSSPIWYTPEA